MSQVIPILRRESTSLSEQAYSQIRSMIITLELEPGSLISESELMATLSVGRTPIREALRLLANEKLVEVYPRRGMFVSRVDVHNLRRGQFWRSKRPNLQPHDLAQQITLSPRLLSPR